MKQPKIGDIIISSDKTSGQETIVGLVLSDAESGVHDDADWFKVMVPGGQIRDFFIPKPKRRKPKGLKHEDSTATR